MFHRMASLVFVPVAVFIMSTAAFAQTPAARSEVTAAAGLVNFDLSGTGTVLGLSGRGTLALTDALAVEGHLLWARPDQQFGTSQITVAEAQVQYFWRLGRLRPYIGGGAGALVNRSDVFTESDFTVSGAGGARIDVTDRVALLGEFRLRGVEWANRSFTGTTAEVMAGVTVALGR